MRRNYAKKGSVLILVVALLVLLAMLGSVFLFTARSNYKVNRILAQSDQHEHLASGIIQSIKAYLKDDIILKNDNNTPANPGDDYYGLYQFN